MNWMDLHGDQCDRRSVFPPFKGAIWCDYCCDWIDPHDLVRWSPDGAFTYFLCPGCDSELREPVAVDD